MTQKQMIEKWRIIFTKMKDDLCMREYDECVNGLKDKIYLSITEIDELLTILNWSEEE